MWPRPRGIALMALALAGCGDGPTPPDETVTLRDRIVFVVDTGPYPLMSMKPDGSDRRPIPVTLPSFPTAPAISPNGLQISFELEFAEIYIVNADGTGLRDITNTGALDIRPRWSPDGANIAFSSSRGVNGEYDIYSIRLADSMVRLISDAPGDEYVQDWSSDGKWLLSTRKSDSTSGDVWRISVATGQGVQLTSSPGYDGGGAYSPDGQMIAFAADRSRGSEIFLMNADGSAERPLAMSAATYGYSPQWSPDGQWLVYSDGGIEVLQARLDGTAFVNLGRGRAPTWGPGQ